MSVKYSEAELARMREDPGCVQLYASRVKLSKQGRRWVGLCPFHPDKTPSFSVNQKGRDWLWGCFPCNASGNIFEFIQKTDGVEFPEAAEIVHQYLYGSKSDAWEETKARVDQVFQPLSGPKKFKTYPLEEMKLVEEALAKSDDARRWLHSRGITLQTAQQMHLGYRQNLELAKLKDPDIAGAGWIVFPSIEDGVIRSIKFRSVARKAFYRQPNMETGLYGVHNVDLLRPLMVVEGEVDAITLQQSGYAAVSLPSASISVTPEMKDIIMSAPRVILAGDSDNAGSIAMEKLWQELKENTFLLHWPEGCKDANETFLKAESVENFRETVDDLIAEAMVKPAPYVTSLEEAMTAGQQTNLKDAPNRLRFPWRAVDEMAIILPGSVIGVLATNTGMGKTTLVHEAALYGARNFEEVVLNYQCELSESEMVTLTAANVLGKHRNHLTQDDLSKAKEKISGIRYYIGRNPNLSTVAPTLDLIEDSIRRLGATIVVLDNLHFICRNEENEVQAQANAMQRIKQMAQRYKVKFIVVGQPRKAKQDSRGKQIHLTDWRGSAAGVDDADVLFIMHREWIKTTDPEHPPMDQYDSRTTITRAKARACGDGPAVAQLMFMGAVATFRELDYNPDFELLG